MIRARLLAGIVCTVILFGIIEVIRLGLYAGFDHLGFWPGFVICVAFGCLMILIAHRVDVARARANRSRSPRA